MKFYQKHKQLSMWVAAFIFVAAVIVLKQILTALPQIMSFLGTLVSILSPFIVGFILAFILFVPCNKLEKLIKKIKRPKFFSKHARGISVFLVYIVCVTIIAVALALVAPWLVKSLMSIYNDRMMYYEKAVNFIVSKCDADGKLFGLDPAFIIEMLNPDKYLSNINIEQLNLIANGVYKFGSAIVDMVLAIFSSVYMLISRERLMVAVGRFLTLFAPRKRIIWTYNYLGRVAGIFYSYMYSTLIDALVVAVFCSIAFVVIGVDYALVFGLLVGFANLVPYFGAIVAGVSVAVFTALTDGIVKAIIVAAVILVIQQLDSNLLQPKIVGETVGIPPLYTLIAITVGGGLFGFGGIIIGVPIMATLMMVVDDLIKYKNRKLAEKEIVDKTDQE